jgi:hypothetical protein
VTIGRELPEEFSVGIAPRGTGSVVCTCAVAC